MTINAHEMSNVGDGSPDSMQTMAEPISEAHIGEVTTDLNRAIVFEERAENYAIMSSDVWERIMNRRRMLERISDQREIPATMMALGALGMAAIYAQPIRQGYARFLEYLADRNEDKAKRLRSQVS